MNEEPLSFLGGPWSGGLSQSPPRPCLGYFSRIGFSTLPQLADFRPNMLTLALALSATKENDTMMTFCQLGRENRHGAQDGCWATRQQ